MRNHYRDQILTISAKFGMTNNFCANIVGLSYSSFQKCKYENSPSHKFSKKHVDKLIEYIREQTKTLDKYDSI